MSLLLEALKRAALEKQSRGEDDEPKTIAPNPDIDLSDSLVFDIGEVEELGEHEWQDNLDLDLETLDVGAKQESLSPASALVALEKAKEKNRNTNSIQIASEYQTDTAGDQAKEFSVPSDISVPVETFEIDREELESLELDQKRLAEEKQEQEKRLENQIIEDQRRQKEVEAENLRIEKTRLKELSRQEEEKQKLQSESRAALQDLLKSGERVEQRIKKRKFILYVILILTALISLSIYYYYIIQNRSDFRPRQSHVTPVVSQNSETKEKAGTNLESELVSVLVEADSAEQKGTLRYSPNFEITRQDDPPSMLSLLNIIDRSEKGGGPKVSVSDVNRNSDLKVILHQQVVPVRLGELIQDGYLDFKAGNYQSAELLYSEALTLAPNNRDALLGLAAIATEDRRWQEAFQYYTYLLNIDSNDEYARAGILSLTQVNGNSTGMLRELNGLLEKNPNIAYLHFLKATALANDNQWSEAQRTFYQAYSLDNTNPDYAYNLAISLDHLEQEKEALAFYRRALFLGGQQLSNFSNGAIVQRMKELRENMEVQP